MEIKKIIFALFMLLLSANLYAGDYDGVWDFGGEYNMARQNGDQMVFVSLFREINGWEALLGNISGNSVEVTTLFGPEGNFKHATIEFTSTTEGFVTIHSCNNCGAPINVLLPITKIF